MARAPTLRPVHDILVVVPDKPPSESAGGIIRLEKYAEKQTKGAVRAAGPGRIDNHGRLIPMTVKVGDRVAYGTFVGMTIEVDGEKLVLVGEKDILAVEETASSKPPRSKAVA
jgi:chaperonin GroES